MNATRLQWGLRINQVKSEGRIPIIAEVKISSPARGNLRKSRSIEEIALAYVEGGAACLSVVTGRWFGGEISMLKDIAAITNLPLLRKDFITNEQQIVLSKKCGANAVLLTQQLLGDKHLNSLILSCLEYGITPFVEINQLDSLAEIPDEENVIVALCNRNILIKELDTNSGLPSAMQIKEVGKRKNIFISASGIDSNENARKLFNDGFDGLLVGTFLLESKCVESAVREMSMLRDQTNFG